MNEPRSTLTPDFMGDLSRLEVHGHGPRSLTWWGLMGMIAIEGTAFLLAGATYLYLASQVPQWPPAKLPPAWLWGVVFSAVLLLSAVPNEWLKRQAEQESLRAVRIGLVLMSMIGLALCAVRYLEFTALRVSWSDSAYGSIVVVVLGLHTVHLVTDLIDTLVLAALMFTRHAYGRRFVDTAENAIYWNFVVLAWLPIYVLLYLVPRWLQS
ncbi:MAG TPA: cytochrome c oxidase subunit 3 [Steroidobacteraceae bacterium]|jgi:heme/copper-type cytochrome/quinol oxidase subunit 3